MSEDPVADPNNPNLYTYCRNNPLRYIDPTGLWSGESSPLGPDGGWGSGWNTGGSGGSGGSSSGGGSGAAVGVGSILAGTGPSGPSSSVDWRWESKIDDGKYNPATESIEYSFISVAVPVITERATAAQDGITAGPSTPESPDLGGAPPPPPSADNTDNDNNNQSNWGLVATAVVSASQKALEDKAKSIDPTRYISYDNRLIIWTNPVPKYLKFASYSIGGIYEAYSLIQIAADNKLTLGQKIMKGVIDVTAFGIEIGIGVGVGAITFGTGPGAVVAGIIASTAVSVLMDMGKNYIYDQWGLN